MPLMHVRVGRKHAPRHFCVLRSVLSQHVSLLPGPTPITLDSQVSRFVPTSRAKELKQFVDSLPVDWR